MVEDKHVNSTAVCKNHLYLSHAAPLSLLPPPPLVGVGSVCTPSSWEPEGGAEGGKRGEEPVWRSWSAASAEKEDATPFPASIAGIRWRP